MAGQGPGDGISKCTSFNNMLILQYLGKGNICELCIGQIAYPFFTLKLSILMHFLNLISLD